MEDQDITRWIWLSLLVIFIIMSFFYCYFEYLSRNRQIQPEQDMPVAREVEMATVVVGNKKLKL